MELFESEEICKQLVCYAVLEKTVGNIEHLIRDYKTTIRDLVNPLLATTKDESFVALLMAVYIINRPKNLSPSHKGNWFFRGKNKGYTILENPDYDLEGFSTNFKGLVDALILKMELIKEKYQVFPQLLVPYYE